MSADSDGCTGMTKEQNAPARLADYSASGSMCGRGCASSTGRFPQQFSLEA